MTAPVVAHLEVVSGDDYKAVDGRALSWSSSQWPVLTGASLSMVVGHDDFNLYGNVPVTWSAPAVVTGTVPQTVSLNVTSAQTSVLNAGLYDYTLTATLANGDKVTIATGVLTVIAAPTNVPLYPPAV